MLTETYGIERVKVIFTQQTEAGSGITRDAFAPGASSCSSDPKDCVIDTNVFFGVAGEWGRQNGRTYNSPDHVMVFTRYDVTSPTVLGL